MKRERVDRSSTAIPCMIAFTKPLMIAGLPRTLYYLILGIGVLGVMIFKNIIVGILFFIIYLILVRINYKDYTTLEGFYRMNKKKYISY